MPRYAALLRAINVGGHTVKMDELRAQFEALRFARVESFIASGNIMFDSRSAHLEAMEARIEGRLLSALGYPVETFVRTPAELAAVGLHRPFPVDDPVVEGHALQVIFLKSALDAAAEQRLLGLCSDYDDFEAVGREVYWRCRGRMSDSRITAPIFARALPTSGTARNITTVRKLAAKLATGAG